MKRWTKRKTFAFSFLALLASIGLGAGTYAITQWTKVPAKTAVIVQEPAKKKVQELPKLITADEIATGVNQERVKNGLNALAVNALLNQSACLKADDMISKGYWSHVSPEGTQPWYWFGQVGYDYSSAGENLGYGFNSSDSQVSAWMNSPGHRVNILGSTFSEMGVCVKYAQFQGSAHKAVIVNHFGSLR